MNEFDKWNELKKQINNKEINLKFRGGDIFFMSIGKNVGSEQVGKGEEFLRPVLVYKKLSKTTFLGIPLTSTKKDWYFEFHYKNKISYAMFNQMRTFDIKRIKFKYGRIKFNTFKKLSKKLEEFITPLKREEDPLGRISDKSISQTNKNVNKIYLSPPHMSGKEIEYVKKVFESNYIAPLGEYVDKFENSVKNYTGAKAALALCNATSALHLALRVLGIKDSKVAVPTFTFIGSVNPILYERNEPVFIDVDEYWHMDAELLEKAIKENNIKAVVLPHIYGQVADIEPIKELCEKNGIYLIEDAAESLGAYYKWKMGNGEWKIVHSGTIGVFGVYSFNGNKLLTTSSGGVLVSNDGELIKNARFLSTQAKESDFIEYVHKEIGFNYRMSNVLAAIGVGQMEVVEERIAKKKEIFEWYQEFLDEEFMPELPNTRGTRWLTTVVFKNKDPWKVMQNLKDNQIESRPLWNPMHLQSLFKGVKSYLNGRSEKLFKKGLCLPSGTALSKNDVKYICEVINEVK
ncbi:MULTISPECIES: DegT/DnrJ/EryC1/StrS family aminotransferase [unclassified Lebetimonas]|uniref:DegT/DnrJ/EryC1/StrS family aminotransferase n=1 Tax=unclassified Lebetimonas TaxID=2648158 RepID=UPI0004637A1D|nr:MULTISPECIES: DegT/DnrJ/EryC1/StrS family aminotransferase [unclassified Lebetimonas]